MKYYITYTVAGFPGRHKAGPYEQSEVASQKRDIEFYDTWDVQVIPENEMPVDPVPIGERLQNPIL